MQLKALSVSKELQAVKVQQASLARRIKLSEATEQQIKETASTASDASPPVTIWKGVGKMFLSTSLDDQFSSMSDERQELKDQISALDKKNHYLETTYQNLTNSLASISIKN